MKPNPKDRKQMASDAWWVFIAFFLICIVERDALSIPSPGFDLYAVFFETVTAFGTVGVSTGVPYDTYAFSGAWHTLSKLILIVVMLRGRHRGLPMAIDRAVLLPGQELMERLDKEYKRSGDEKRRTEEEEENRRVRRQEVKPKVKRRVRIPHRTRRRGRKCIRMLAKGLMLRLFESGSRESRRASKHRVVMYPWNLTQSLDLSL